eukprot:Plantae.Rhodophyta-Purpureofilum_apyrenoidigerum.ctg3858.p2 GENE.Plantae.Rhodophyta-Purpureofilum_apyrenoidigerum.ctg3858~~Plantae.Rhodophyta-Purpureofilum_apyrenoidigerum.ctg3858.p2  ORF type:complete len:200 (+),score=34.45 Plantae.Rhodophyta-Purpureofilum_apyrenoidigerum.ctg3858:162-761(+)
MRVGFIAGTFKTGCRTGHQRTCHRRTVSASVNQGNDGELERRRRLFEYYDKLGDDLPKKSDGWILIYGSEMAMFENNLLEAGIAPAHEVYSMFITDVQLEYELKGSLEHVYVLGWEQGYVTLKDEDKIVLLTFEGFEEAQRYAMQMEAQGTSLPSVQKMSVEKVMNLARRQDMFRGMIPRSTIVQPPSGRWSPGVRHSF